MEQFQAFRLFILVLVKTASIEAFNSSLNGCQVTCGHVTIPYPFGIGPNCSINKWYNIDCNSSIPYLSALNNLEVMRVSVEDQAVIARVSMITGCKKPVQYSSEIMSIDLDGSPFLFNKFQNILVVKGCGNAVLLDRKKVVSGCSTTCHNDTVSEKNNCFGISCCQSTFPYHLKSYILDFTGFQNQSHDGTCESSFIVDKQNYLLGKSSGVTMVGVQSLVPVSLLWTLTENDMKEINCNGRNGTVTFDLGNGKSVKSGQCTCENRFDGNPYLPHGCEKVNLCKSCEHNRSLCSFSRTYDLDGLYYTGWEASCGYNNYDPGSSKSSLAILLGVSVSVGILILVAVIYASFKLIKKTKAKRRKARFFKRNGGLLLKQQESTDTDVVDKTILFTSSELEKATDHFNENRILGRGGQGTVYKGMLADGRIVAVKKSKVVDESQLEQFINEVVILSQVNHRNVVKLLGCCLETEVPLLVSEFVPNGTLFDLIQDDTGEFLMSLDMRLQIATEVAGALSYLHSSTSLPIYHRDIKTTNILLDEKFKAKVSDFGTSRLVSIDQTHLTTLVKGTFGYLDPEYFQSSQFTEKSDVYSFGVVLVELLTREKPISFTRFGENRNLATHFTSAMEEGRVMSIFDAMIVKEGSRSVVLSVANLAMRCLSMNGKNRPTMKEVAMELEGIKTEHMPSTIESSFGQMNSSDGQPILAFGKSASTTESLH